MPFLQQIANGALANALQTTDKPHTNRIGLFNLSRSAALPFSPGGAGFNEPSTACARLFIKINFVSNP